MRPAGGIARLAVGKPPALLPSPLFPLFYLVEIRHSDSFKRNPECRCAEEYNANTAITRQAVYDLRFQARGKCLGLIEIRPNFARF